MIDVNDYVSVARACELLYYGVDISQLDKLKQYYNPVTKQLQSRLSPNIPNFGVIFEQDVLDYWQWCLGQACYRDQAAFNTVFLDAITAEDKPFYKITANLDMVKQVMTILKNKGFAQFDGFPIESYDSEYLERLAQLKKNWDRKSLEDCQDMITNLAHDNIKVNLHAMLACAEYPLELGNKILSTFNNPEKQSEIELFKDYEVIDNRIYIRVAPWEKEQLYSKHSSRSKYIDEIKYIVISRNPYDFFFCSYGSGIQSCYSLNSTNFGWHGMVALSGAKGNYIVYATSGKCNKIPLIQGSKWYVPRMLFRMWGWLDTKGELRLDRLYRDENMFPSDMERSIRDFIAQYFEYDDAAYNRASVSVSLKYDKDMKEIYDTYYCHFYPDSIKVETFKFHGVCYGDRSFKGSCTLSRSLFNILQDITSIDKNFTFGAGAYEVVDGVLTIQRKCPRTGLPLKPDEVVSPYAKYFKEDVSKVVVLTYCDGYYKLDTAWIKAENMEHFRFNTNNFNQMSYRESDGTYYAYPIFCVKKIAINTFKEQMTGLAKQLDIDAILVRYIEGERVTVVKYRGSKQ